MKRLTTNAPRKATTFQLVFWGLVFCVGVVTYWPGFATPMLRPTRVADFFQEWASARNYVEGHPIYTPQEITAIHYLNYNPSEHPFVFVRINGHPPTTVLVGLPFARLPYETALLIWNWISLAAMIAAAVIALRFERCRLPAWYWLPLLTMLFSNSLLQHLIMGQLGTLIVLLLVGAAWADDRGKQGLAGLLLGSATAIKLFPALLFAYLVVNRRWRAAGVGIATIVAWMAAAWWLFGTQTFADYVNYAMPEVLRYRDWWANYSISGEWFKLFDCANNQTTPLWRNPGLARAGAALTTAAFASYTIWLAYVGRRRLESRRTSLALMIAALVFVSPVAWDHYFVLLLWPLLRLAASLGDRKPAQFAFCCLAAVLWLNPMVLRATVALPNETVSLWGTLTLVSIPFYALLVLYVLLSRQVWLDAAQGEISTADTKPRHVEMQRDLVLSGAR